MGQHLHDARAALRDPQPAEQATGSGAAHTRQPSADNTTEHDHGLTARDHRLFGTIDTPHRSPICLTSLTATPTSHRSEWPLAPVAQPGAKPESCRGDLLRHFGARLVDLWRLSINHAAGLHGPCSSG